MFEPWITLDENHDPETIKKYHQLFSKGNCLSKKGKRIEKKWGAIQPQNKKLRKLPTLNSSYHRSFGNIHGVINEQLLAKIYGTREKQIFFSYFRSLLEEILKEPNQQEKKQYNSNAYQQKLDNIQNDINLISREIFSSQDVTIIANNAQDFKKKSQCFKFKTPHSRILFHIILAQLAIHQRDLNKVTEQLQFCEYYSRKNNFDQLTVCFLWHISMIQISLTQYDKALCTVKNLLEMAVVTRKSKAIKFGLEKISLIYYYQGNAFMGQYYHKKAETGLGEFEQDIYTRQYNSEDQLRRLEEILFQKKKNSASFNALGLSKDPRNLVGTSGALFSSQSLFPNLVPKTIKMTSQASEECQNSSSHLDDYQQFPKRKLNLKYQLDLYNQELEKIGCKRQQFVDDINIMIKNYENSKTGFKIRQIMNRNNGVGSVYQFRHINIAGQASKQTINQYSLRKDRKNFNKASGVYQSMHCSNENQGNKQKGSEGLSNQTRIIKSHLSGNRENTKLNSEQRWKKTTAFIWLIEQRILQNNKSSKILNKKPINKFDLAPNYSIDRKIQQRINGSTESNLFEKVKLKR